MVMAATNHEVCDEYFSVICEAINMIMQRVYGDLEAHNQAFIRSGFVSSWDERLAELAKGRWIDTIFGISALMSISTQLSYSKNSEALCCNHGIPVIKLAEATSINIATNMIKDSQLHLHSLLIKEKLGPVVGDSSLQSTEQKIRQLDAYFVSIQAAKKIVIGHTNSHRVEMVFSQFPFESLIKDQWLEKGVA